MNIHDEKGYLSHVVHCSCRFKYRNLMYWRRLSVKGSHVKLLFFVPILISCGAHFIVALHIYNLLLRLLSSILKYCLQWGNKFMEQ